MTHPSKEIYKSYWARRNSYAQRAREQGIVLVRQVGNRLQVTVPYSESFVLQAHKIGGRWRKRSEMWSFPVSLRRELLGAISAIFGDGKVNRKVEE